MQIMQVGYKDFIHLTYGIPQLHVYACGVCMWCMHVVFTGQNYVQVTIFFT